MDWQDLLVAVLEQVLSIAGKVVPGQAGAVIAILEKVLPVAVEAEQALIGPIQNIIRALRTSGTLTPDEFAALQVQSDAIDAALDAAARDDGLVG